MKLDIKTILWYNKDKSDKVWAAFEADGRMYCAWGRRGGTLRFKDHGRASVYGNATIRNLIYEKQHKKGYTVTDEFQLFLLFPDFQERVEKGLFNDLVEGKVM